ncbi:MAG: hypothetical protein KDB03_24760 [Planctomycetales bacterium]|nr:hypothetical protein [Planctomycetales bacterium]
MTERLLETLPLLRPFDMCDKGTHLAIGYDDPNATVDSEASNLNDAVSCQGGNQKTRKSISYSDEVEFGMLILDGSNDQRGLQSQTKPLLCEKLQLEPSSHGKSPALLELRQLGDAQTELRIDDLQSKIEIAPIDWRLAFVNEIDDLEHSRNSELTEKSTQQPSASGADRTTSVAKPHFNLLKQTRSQKTNG